MFSFLVYASWKDVGDPMEPWRKHVSSNNSSFTLQLQKKGCLKHTNVTNATEKITIWKLAWLFFLAPELCEYLNQPSWRVGVVLRNIWSFTRFIVPLQMVPHHTRNLMGGVFPRFFTSLYSKVPCKMIQMIFFSFLMLHETVPTFLRYGSSCSNQSKNDK